MATVVTVREVPDDVRDALAQQARDRGQSLQAYLLAILRRQASFARNREVLAEIESELAAGGAAGPDAPDAAEILARARARARSGAVAGEPSSRRKARSRS